MITILRFNNMHPWLRESSTFDSTNRVVWTTVGPGRYLRANIYSKRKHIGIADAVRRLVNGLFLAVRALRHDVLVVDSALTSFIVALLLFLFPRPLIIAGTFNVPRRRTGIWLRIARVLLRRVDHIVVHSHHDVNLVSTLFNVDRHRVSFVRYARTGPAEGRSDPRYRPPDDSRFILSIGSNARDYDTLFKAAAGTDLHFVVVAREHNMKGLFAPKNVHVFCNIPLHECDRLVRDCHFTVFTFDGSEPSCGQISVVTSFLVGKPAVCTESTGMCDYVVNGVNGLAVRMKDVDDLREKMLAVWNDSNLHRQLSDGASRWASQFGSVEAYWGEVAEIAKKSVAKRGARAASASIPENRPTMRA